MSAPPEIEFVDSVTSDLAFVARGESLDAAFAAAAEALLAATVENPEAVEPRLETELALEEPDVELLLLGFLNELVYLRDARGWLLRAARLHVEVEPGRAALRARLAGETIDRTRHRLAGEVKAATAHGLRVGAGPRGGFEVAATLDV